MKIQEYIESGNLEAYVLGELPLQQVQQIEKLMDKHPELRNEVFKIQDIIGLLALQVAVEPPISVKEKLFRKFDANLNESKPEEDAKIIPFKSKQDQENNNQSFMKYLVAASVSIAILASVMAVNFWYRFKVTDQELGMVLAQNQQIEREFNTVSHKLDKIYNDFELISDRKFTTVELDAATASPGSAVTVFWMEESGEIYLKISNLQTPAATYHYQLWAMVDGKPVDAGSVNLSEGAYSLLKMNRIKNVSSFIITLEKDNVATPNLEKIVVSGKL